MLKSKHTKPLQAVISILIPMTLCTLATTSYADNLSTNAPLTGKAAKTNDSLPILYCPPVNTIKRSNDYIWTAKVEGGWKHNGLRHSFCSYRAALTKNMNQTAFEAGNSPAMIQRHYWKTVSEKQAKQWFAIMPEEAKNVVRVIGLTK